MHLKKICWEFCLKCIVKNLSWRENGLQMVFLANSDFFHFIETRKCSFKFGLFDLGWKYQGRTVTWYDNKTHLSCNLLIEYLPEQNLIYTLNGLVSRGSTGWSNPLNSRRGFSNQLIFWEDSKVNIFSKSCKWVRIKSYQRRAPFGKM